MPKMKSHSGLKKRVKISKRGKVMYKKSGARHLMITKSSSKKRSMRKFGQLGEAASKMVRRLLPYA